MSPYSIYRHKKRAHINVSSQNPKVDFIFSYVAYAATINSPPSVTVADDKSIESTVPSPLTITCRPAALVCEAS